MGRRRADSLQIPAPPRRQPPPPAIERIDASNTEHNRSSIAPIAHHAPFARRSAPQAS